MFMKFAPSSRCQHASSQSSSKKNLHYYGRARELGCQNPATWEIKVVDASKVKNARENDILIWSRLCLIGVRSTYFLRKSILSLYMFQSEIHNCVLIVQKLCNLTNILL